MITDIAQLELERKLHKAKEGFTSLPSLAAPFAFAEQPMVREAVIERLQRGLDVFEEERRTRAAHEAAVEARKNAVPRLTAFHAAAMAIARSHFGSDAKKMATFEAPRPVRTKRRSRRCSGEGGEVVVTTVVEEVTTVSEQAPCESQAPKCGEGTREPRCRGSRLPKRVAKPPCKGTRLPKRVAKPPCEGAKGCGSRVSRGVKGGRG